MKFAGGFEPTLLPDSEKKELCESLLREFGVTQWRATDRGELIHSCPLPNTRHRNGDRNPSASVNYRKLTFNCLGCGSKGGLLWWIATCRGEGSEEARAWLEGATGTGQTVMDLPRLLELLDALASPASPRAPIPRYDQSVLAPWTEWPIHHPYLTDQPPDGRGCPSSTLQFFSIGYSDQYFDGTERIIIPLFWRDDLVGWQARRIAPWDEPKYKNSPDFPRDRLIYNSHDLPTAVVVESPLSVLRHHHHCPNLLATFGAEVAASQMQWLQRYQRTVLWYDNDPAGWEATERVGRALEPYNSVWVVQSPYDADPADLDDTTVEQLIEDAVPLSIWQQPQELQQLEWRPM